MPDGLLVALGDEGQAAEGVRLQHLHQVGHDGPLTGTEGAHRQVADHRAVGGAGLLAADGGGCP